MTNNDKSAIILKEVELPFSVEEKTITIKLKMEAYAEINNNSIPRLKSKSACKNNKKMTEVNVDLREATNYLIQLFYKTEKKYSCTRTKLGKLLSIVSFVYARNDQKIFKETIYKYDNCGTAIREVMDRFKDRAIYFQCSYQDDSKIISEKAEKNIKFPDDFKDISHLDKAVKQTIRRVFLTFGSYSPAALGECINPIVNLNNVTNDNNEVDLSTLKNIKLEDFKINDSTNRSLIEFLF